MKPVWIELVNTGVANRLDYGDFEVVEMNWRLTDYPKLYQYIFKHEMSHNEGNYKTHDFIHDMKSRTPGLFKFMSSHISAWTQLLPFYYSRRHKHFFYDISSIASWIMVAGLATGAFYFLRWLL